MERKVMLGFVQQVNVTDLEMFYFFYFSMFKDCGSRYETYNKNCIGSRINLDRLAQSIRELIKDTKVKIISTIFERKKEVIFLENCLSKCSNNPLYMSINTNDSITSRLQYGIYISIRWFYESYFFV